MKKRNLTLFALGFMGVLSMLPVIPQLLALEDTPPPLPIWLLQLLSMIQPTVLLSLMLWLGAAMSKRVGLGTPLLTAFEQGESLSPVLQKQALPALLGGIGGGMAILSIYILFAGSLPTEFLTNAEKLTMPWYTRLLYGGITEEVLIRWGLMSFFVWGSYALFQGKSGPVAPHHYIIAIVLSSLLFGLGHLPVAFTLTSDVTVSLLLYIVLANASFGLIAGTLYWKYGLEAAIGAHMIAHVTMIVGEKIFT